MNIFQVLSQGKGRLNEENMSAMLAFLLNPQQSHGIKDLFLKRFINLIKDSSGVDYNYVFDTNYKFDITLESPYDVDGSTKYIDLDIKFFTDTGEVLRILIENKIKISAAQKEQFKYEYLGVLNSLEDESKDIEVAMVFLTPDYSSQLLRDEYDELSQDLMQTNHNKAWILWNSHSGKQSVADVLKRILHEEARMEINPISEYVRHTIKAFVRHIIDTQKDKKTSDRSKPLDDDVLLKELEIEIKGTRFRIEQYSSSAIKIYNIESEKYEVTKKLLRTINETYNLGVELESKSGRKNTRILGRDIINALERLD